MRAIERKTVYLDNIFGIYPFWKLFMKTVYSKKNLQKIMSKLSKYHLIKKIKKKKRTRNLNNSPSYTQGICAGIIRCQILIFGRILLYASTYFLFNQWHERQMGQTFFHSGQRKYTLMCSAPLLSAIMLSILFLLLLDYLVDCSGETTIFCAGSKAY